MHIYFTFPLAFFFRNSVLFPRHSWCRMIFETSREYGKKEETNKSGSWNRYEQDFDCSLHVHVSYVFNGACTHDERSTWTKKHCTWTKKLLEVVWNVIGEMLIFFPDSLQTNLNLTIIANNEPKKLKYTNLINLKNCFNWYIH